MLQVGKTQTLIVDEEIPYGAYLSSADGERVMLPVSQLPEDISEGDNLSVFVYHDHDGQLTATTKRPLIEVGQCAKLKVVGSSPAGAFLNWGLDKDLFVPKKQQAQPMQVDQEYMVVAYLDERDGRIIASSKLHQHLSEQNVYFKPGQQVSLLISDETELGFKAVINQSALGLLYHTDVFQPLAPGQQITGYIAQIREDGKIDLSLRAPGGADRTELEAKILQHLTENGGHSPITDKSDPKLIQKIFKVSKGAYKKALGSLYKQQKITLTKAEIRLKD